MANKLDEFKKKLSDVKMIPCFRVNEKIMNGIKDEVRKIIESHGISLVQQKAHLTNWTKPYGTALQYSLYNTSGNTEDFSTDHNISQKDNDGVKNKFFFDQNYKNIYSIFCLFKEGVTNFRLNGLGKNSGLSPHKEYTIHDERYRIRFHLPVFTNNLAWTMLEGEKFWFKPGIIYFFNNGLIHSAGNEDEETRYHLIWDLWLNDYIFDNFLDIENKSNPSPELLHKISEKERQELTQSKPYKITNYEDQLEGTKIFQ